jgi:hypothetical protein
MKHRIPSVKIEGSTYSLRGQNRYRDSSENINSNSLCSSLHPPVTLSLFSPNILLSTLFSKTVSVAL